VYVDLRESIEFAQLVLADMQILHVVRNIGVQRLDERTWHTRCHDRERTTATPLQKRQHTSISMPATPIERRFVR
jgi:hypothetical protein